MSKGSSAVVESGAGDVLTGQATAGESGVGQAGKSLVAMGDTAAFADGIEEGNDTSHDVRENVGRGVAAKGKRAHVNLHLHVHYVCQ